MMAALSSKSHDHVFLPIEEDDDNSQYEAFAEASEQGDVTEFVKNAVKAGKTGPGLVLSETQWVLSANSDRVLDEESIQNIESIKGIVKEKSLPLVICLPNRRLLASRHLHPDKELLLLANNEIFMEGADFIEWFNIISTYENDGILSNLAIGEMENFVFHDRDWLRYVQISESAAVSIDSKEKQDNVAELLELYFEIYSQSDDINQALEVGKAKESESMSPVFSRSESSKEEVVSEQEILRACTSVKQSLDSIVLRGIPKPQSAQQNITIRKSVEEVLIAKGYSVERNAHPSLPKSPAHPSNVSATNENISGWCTSDDRLASWIVRAKTRDRHFIEAAEFLSGRKLTTFADLADFICNEKPLPIDCPARYLQFSRSTDEKSVDTPVKKLYWCSKGAVMSSYLLSGLVLYLTIIVLIFFSVLIGIRAQDTPWQQAESSMNLILTGAVGIILGTMGLEVNGRQKFLDSLTFTYALPELPQRKAERRKILKMLRKVRAPHQFFAGSMSWLPHEGQGFTRADYPIPLEDFNGGIVRLSASGLSCDILGKERALNVMDNGVLTAGEFQKSRRLSATIHIYNRIK